MKKNAVIGGSGMVASRFVKLAKDSFKLTSLDEKTVDITDKDSVNKYFSENSFDTIINFAAYTNVDGAEKERGKEGIVWRLNVEGPRNLIRLCKDKNIFLIQISTDFVFPGDESSPGPYSEDDEPLEKFDARMGWYGWTKRIAEKDFLESEVKGAIIRYGYPFRADDYEPKLDWARNLLKLYNEQKLYPLFDDQIYSILFIDELAKPLLKIINEHLTGMFHIASNDTASPYETGKYLLGKYLGKEVELKKSSMTDFLKTPGRTPRPQFGGLKNEVTRKRLNMEFKSWKEMIDEFLDQLGKIK